MAKQRFHSATEISANPELAKGLLSHAEALLALEEQANAIKAQKADLFDAMRDAAFDPAHAKAWVAEQLIDPEKAEAKLAKQLDAGMIIDALEDARVRKGRARARAIATGVPVEPPHDPETGEIIDASSDDRAGDGGNGGGDIGTGSVQGGASTDNEAGAGEGGPAYADAPSEGHAGAGEEGGASIPAEATPVASGSAEPVGGGPEAREEEGAQPEDCSSRRVLSDAASDGLRFAPKPGDPFLNPHHTVSSFMRGSLCQSLGLDDDDEPFRAAMIAGRSAQDALNAARAGA